MRRRGVAFAFSVTIHGRVAHETSAGVLYLGGRHGTAFRKKSEAQAAIKQTLAHAAAEGIYSWQPENYAIRPLRWSARPTRRTSRAPTKTTRPGDSARKGGRG